MKFEILRDQLAQCGGSLAEVRAIATSIGVMQDRYLARPAAEMLIARGAPGSDQMAATLRTMPITGKDYKGDMLRAAFRAALEREGIGPDVENVARAFYERRQKARLGDPVATGSGWSPAPSNQPPQAQPRDPSQPPGLGDMLGDAVRKLFGGS
jgi:hypothetical protein